MAYSIRKGTMGLCRKLGSRAHRGRCALCHVAVRGGKPIASIIYLNFHELKIVFQIEDMHLVREEDTGKSRGFAFVKYEDARSGVLAVDNLVGVKVRRNYLQLNCRSPKSFLPLPVAVVGKIFASGSCREISITKKPARKRRGRSRTSSRPRTWACLQRCGIIEWIFYGARPRLICSCKRPS